MSIFLISTYSFVFLLVYSYILLLLLLYSFLISRFIKSIKPNSFFQSHFIFVYLKITIFVYVLVKYSQTYKHDRFNLSNLPKIQTSLNFSIMFVLYYFNVVNLHSSLKATDQCSNIINHLLTLVKMSAIVEVKPHGEPSKKPIKK